MRRAPVGALAVLIALLIASGCGGSDSGVRIRPVPAADGTSADPGSSPNPNATSTASDNKPVELPFAPDNPISGGLLVADYLAGGLANIEGCLPELVRDWELEPVAGLRCTAADIDSDGRDELVFAVTVAGDPAPGDVWFFDDQDANYRLFTSARALANEILAGVNIEAVVDLTGDGAPEVVISTVTCDGGRCATGFVIASAHRGFAVEDLTPENLVTSSTEGLVFEDGSADGLTDLLIRSEADLEDPAAGPQRGSTLVVSWSGLRFQIDDQPDPPEYLIHLIADADEAYRTGDLALASELYLEAAADRTLRDWKAELGERPGRLELQPYALFRAALVSQRRGDPETALQLLQRAATEHANSIHGLAADAYLQSLKSSNTTSTACSAAEAYLGRLSVVYADIWDYGFANPSHEITNLCR